MFRFVRKSAEFADFLRQHGDRLFVGSVSHQWPWDRKFQLFPLREESVFFFLIVIVGSQPTGVGELLMLTTSCVFSSKSAHSACRESFEPSFSPPNDRKISSEIEIGGGEQRFVSHRRTFPDANHARVEANTTLSKSIFSLSLLRLK